MLGIRGIRSMVMYGVLLVRWFVYLMSGNYDEWWKSQIACIHFGKVKTHNAT